MFFLVFAVLILSNTLAAEEKKFRFEGVYAGGVTPEAITPTDLELICLLLPAYNDDAGNLLSFGLDLPYFRETGKFRYHVFDNGYLQKYDATNNIVTLLPNGKFEGNPHYAPKITFELIKSTKDSGYTYLSFLSFSQLSYVLRTHDEKFGNRGAAVKCPFQADSYKALSFGAKLSTPSSLTEENVDILYNLKPNPVLVKQIVAAKSQLK